MFYSVFSVVFSQIKLFQMTFIKSTKTRAKLLMYFQHILKIYFIIFQCHPCTPCWLANMKTSGLTLPRGQMLRQSQCDLLAFTDSDSTLKLLTYCTAVQVHYINTEASLTMHICE